MYSISIRPELDKKLKKLVNKNRKHYEIIMQKVEEIIKNPHRYKNLKAPLQNLKRVHVVRHFVLTFSIDEKTKTVIFEDFEHHDKIYQK
jgi:YafQ family addiction module toxin component